MIPDFPYHIRIRLAQLLAHCLNPDFAPLDLLFVQYLFVKSNPPDNARPLNFPALKNQVFDFSFEVLFVSVLVMVSWDSFLGPVIFCGNLVCVFT